MPMSFDELSMECDHERITGPDGALEAIFRARQQGKVRFTGIASHNGTEEALDAAVSTGIYDIAMISYNFRIQNREALDAAIARATASAPPRHRLAMPRRKPRARSA